MYGTEQDSIRRLGPLYSEDGSSAQDRPGPSPQKVHSTLQECRVMKIPMLRSLGGTGFLHRRSVVDRLNLGWPRMVDVRVSISTGLSGRLSGRSSSLST